MAASQFHSLNPGSVALESGIDSISRRPLTFNSCSPEWLDKLSFALNYKHVNAVEIFLQLQQGEDQKSQLADAQATMPDGLRKAQTRLVNVQEQGELKVAPAHVEQGGQKAVDEQAELVHVEPVHDPVEQLQAPVTETTLLTIQFPGDHTLSQQFRADDTLNMVRKIALEKGVGLHASDEKMVLQAGSRLFNRIDEAVFTLQDVGLVPTGTITLLHY
jgi:hypothetical protein